MPKLTSAQQTDRRQRILAAAEICFARTGFHATTMQAICREAGISAGALYLYFNSKEALIEGMAEGERERVLGDFAKMRDAPDFMTGMEAITDNCILQMAGPKAAVFLEVVAESLRNPAVCAILRRVDGAIKEAMHELFSRARAAGRIAPAVPVDELVSIMAVIFDGLILRQAIDPSFDTKAISGRMMQAMRTLAFGQPEALAVPAPILERVR